MNKLFLIPILLVPLTISAQNKKVKSMLTKTIAEMKSRSLNSGQVNWDLVTAEAFKLAKDAKRPEELGNSIRYLFQSLNDFHGFLRYKDSVFRWSREKILIPEIYKAEWAKSGNRFFTRQLGDVGYMRIPFVPAGTAQKMVMSLRDSLCKLLTLKPKGLIFDLRLNGGGHAMAMVMGISSVLKYGVVSPGDEIRANGYFRNSKELLTYQEACEQNTSIPIVVITGPFTGSSAEMLTIVLRNRSNTVQLGEATAGYVTSNFGLMVNGANLVIATGYMTDVNGKAYTSRIQPDVSVEGNDDFVNLANDEKVKKSIEWLRNHTKR